MNSKPVTAGLALLLTALVVGVLWANARHTQNLAAANRLVQEQLAAANRELMLGDRQLLLSNAEVMKQLVEQQRQLVQLQERVTGFSDEAIKARRAQGARARAMIELCQKKQLPAELCRNLADRETLELLER